MPNGKIGRNDTCPCGSGLKFKRCCLGQDGAPDQSAELDPVDALTDLRRVMNVFDPLELTSGFGALEMLPENQGFLVDLEVLAQVAAGIDAQGRGPVTRSAMRRLAQHPFLRTFHAMRDPIDGLFTEHVVGPGGDYVVFPGLFAEGGFTLRAYLAATLRAPVQSIPRAFVERVVGPVVALLRLSTVVAGRWSYSGWRPSTPNDDRPAVVAIPPETTFAEFRARMVYTTAELAAAGIEPGALAPFVLSRKEACNSFPHPEDHPLEAKPLVVINDHFVVLSPTSIVTAVRAYLLSQAKAGGLAGALHARIVEAVAWSSHRASLRLGMRPTALPAGAIEGTVSELGRQLLYEIDTDKLCLVQVLPPDVGTRTQEEQANLANRVEVTVRRVNASRRGVRVLVILVLSDGYQRTELALEAPDIDGHLLLLTGDEYELVSLDAEGDSLALWRFCVVEAGSPALGSYSFFNRWSAYRKRDDSFYFNDDEAPNWISLTQGFEQERRCRLRMNWGLVAAPAPAWGGFVEVHRRFDAGIPVFVPLEVEQMRLGEAVLVGGAWVWVRPALELPGAVLPESFRFHLLEALAYWVWQLQMPLSEFLNRGDIDVMEIETAVLGDWNRTELPDEGQTMVVAAIESHSARRSKLRVTLRSSLSTILRTGDNSGERAVMVEVLRAVAELGAPTATEVEHIHEERIQRAIAESMIPPTKKKIFVLPDLLVPVLDPRDLPAPRLIKNAYVGLHAGGLSRAVADVVPGEQVPGTAVSTGHRKALLVGIRSVYLQRLRYRANELEGHQLLSMLVVLNERLVRDERFETFTAPTQAACFHGLEGQTERLMKRRAELAGAGIGVRFLIEFFSAEPPSGAVEPSWDTIDELAAIAYQLVNWGHLAEQIKTGLADHRLSWLKSGRIGIGHEARGWAEGYLRADSLDVLEQGEDGLTRAYEAPEPRDGEVEREIQLDRAFADEFGVSFHDLASAAAALRAHCEAPGRGALAEFALDDLRDLLADRVGMNEQGFNALLSVFALRPRRAWDDTSEVAEPRDIEPWHFNRRWSYLHRPLVILDSPGGRRVLVGPRHFHQAVFNLLDAVISGRYKRNARAGGALRSFIEASSTRKGEAYQGELANWFRQFQSDSLTVETGVKMRPGKPLGPERDLGDLDVLVLDRTARTAWLVEAKNIEAGRTPAEMDSERTNLVGKPDSRQSASGRHIVRARWIATHWDQVSRIYSLGADGWRVVPVIVTREEVVSQYLDGSIIPVRSFGWLKRGGLSALGELLKGDHVLPAGSVDAQAGALGGR